MATKSQIIETAKAYGVKAANPVQRPQSTLQMASQMHQGRAALDRGLAITAQQLQASASDVTDTRLKQTLTGLAERARQLSKAKRGEYDVTSLLRSVQQAFDAAARQAH